MKIKIFISKDMCENCYAVTVGEECFIVDPGEFSPELEAFALENKSRITYILLTHCHFDHVGGALSLKEICEDATLVAHSLENDGLLDPKINLSAYSLPNKISFAADKTVKDLETFKIGGEEILVLHTPGHTVGSVCYKIGDTLFSGDTLFYKSYGRTDFPGGSILQMKNSLNRLSELNGETKVYCGHGLPTTIRREFED